MDVNHLIEKYSVHGPRYTSYPAAPQWSERVSARDYATALSQLPEGAALALYVHIPFCRDLCQYCACNIEVKKERTVVAPYLEALEQEMAHVAQALPRSHTVRQLSLGGGTPTYLTREELERLLTSLYSHFSLAADAECSVEIDPRVTSFEQLRALRQLGINRVSLGVQDFNPTVQRVIRREQSFELTKSMVEECRSLGVESINFDLIYGLPLQTQAHFKQTMAQVIRIGPDRIALYNYAHVPELRPHQKRLEKYPRPDGQERITIFTQSLDQLSEAGYLPIGMDHFAKPGDAMARALRGGTLHRNFMGYTVARAKHLIGFGASAISEIHGGYFQNCRASADYQARVLGSEFATLRGLIPSEDDVCRKWMIQALLCQLEINYAAFEDLFGIALQSYFGDELREMKRFEVEGLVRLLPDSLHVEDPGRLFVRNMAMVFDAYWKPEVETAMGNFGRVRYSTTI